MTSPVALITLVENSLCVWPATSHWNNPSITILTTAGDRSLVIPNATYTINASVTGNLLLLLLTAVMFYYRYINLTYLPSLVVGTKGHSVITAISCNLQLIYGIF